MSVFVFSLLFVAISMIIPKVASLNPAQLKEVKGIVEDFGCTVQEIVGTGRSVYAVIGEERHQILINRVLGLDYIDRFDAVDHPFKLMDIHSEMASHRVSIDGRTLGERPFIIAGHCTIDPKNPELFYQTAQAVQEAGAHALRGGVWKPRTTPYSFQGDSKSLDILMEAKSRVGLPVVTEVMDEEQLDKALDCGVDVLQVGARNALNYSLLKKIGYKTRKKGTPVLLKRSIGMGVLNEFIAAAEYIAAAGNCNVILCPRGTQPTLDGYRNYPDESVTPLLKEKTWAPVVVDTSHSVGRSRFVFNASLAALAYQADGIIVESHINPKKGIGDDPKQAIKPDELEALVKAIEKVWDLQRPARPEHGRAAASKGR